MSIASKNINGEKIQGNLNITSVTSSFFLVTSASIDLFKINNSGSVLINSNEDTPFLIKNHSNNNILSVSQSGVVIFSTQSIELSAPAPNGGIYFTSESFYVGLD